MKEFFITGTGTNVGKTYVTTSLCYEFIRNGCSVNAIKPVMAGFKKNGRSDTEMIIKSLGKPINKKNIDLVSPWRVVLPFSPDAVVGTKISFSDLTKFCKKASKGKSDLFFL